MSLSTMRANDEVITYFALWDIGSNGAHTKTSGVPGTGFSSVTVTDTGEYTINFSEVPSGTLIDLVCTPWAAVDTEPVQLAPVGSYSASAKTMKYESWEIDETAAHVHIPSGNKVAMRATFLKTK